MVAFLFCAIQAIFKKSCKNIWIVSFLILSLCYQTIKAGGNWVKYGENKMTLLNNFRNLINGDQDTSGTDHNLRNHVWAEFTKKYPNCVTLDIDGAIITLQAEHSISGKTTSYWATIDEGMYKWLTGSSFGLKKRKTPSISIQLGVITIYGGGNYSVKISNEKINAIL